MAHGGMAVVTTSQLHSRGEIPPTQVGTTDHGLGTPAPITVDSVEEFSTSHLSSNSDTIEFEHWSGGMGIHVADSDSDSDNDFEFEGGEFVDNFGQFAFNVSDIDFDEVRNTTNFSSCYCLTPNRTPR
jgi:hypothetical protein